MSDMEHWNKTFLLCRYLRRFLPRWEVWDCCKNEVGIEFHHHSCWNIDCTLPNLPNLPILEQKFKFMKSASQIVSDILDRATVPA